MITPNWQMWDFDYIEIGLRDYARKNDLHYDPKHPLSILPDNAAKNALIAAGSNYGEIAKYMPASEKTVKGWFRPGRNPGRSTVAKDIVPSLCEAYLRHNEDDNFRFFFDRSGYIYQGKQPSRDYLQMVQHRVFMLLTTGSKQTPDDNAYKLEILFRAYYKEALRYAACTLHDDELKDLSRIALLVLKSHMVTAHGSTDSSDASSGVVNKDAWIFSVGDQADLQEGEIGGTAKLEELLNSAANELKSAAISIRLRDMSDSELESLSACADEIRERRERERIEVAKQLFEDGCYDIDEDDDVWNH